MVLPSSRGNSCGMCMPTTTFVKFEGITGHPVENRHERNSNALRQPPARLAARAARRPAASSRRARDAAPRAARRAAC
eukprot:scaffold126207_cov72-Phaeocystis_antarctica.AAC.2